MDDRSSDLQSAQIALGKNAARKIRRRIPKLLLIERSQVVGKQADFLQLCGSRANCFTNLGERRKFGCYSGRRALLELVGRVSRAVALCRREARSAIVCRRLYRYGLLRQPELHLIFFIQRPGLDAAFA